MHRKWWTLLAVSVATFMLLLDVTIVNVALPDIRRSLGSSFEDLQWVIDAYALALAALLLTAGSVAEHRRSQARLHRRPRRLHRRFARLRALDDADDAQPLARRPGRRRGDDVRDRAGPDRPGCSTGASAAPRSASGAP